LKIYFSSARLKKICNDPKAALCELPTQKHVDKLFQRLNELSAFKSLNFVPVTPPLRRHKLSGAMRDMWAVDIISKIDGWRICFSVIYNDTDAKSNSDLNKIEAIRIEKIKNYHNG